jgi:competence protein ComEA
MATPSEQKALAFVAMIVLLGGVVRVVRAGAVPDPSSAEQQALARQAVAAESAAAGSAEARSRTRKARAPKAVRPRKSAAEPTVIGGVASVPAGTPPGTALSHHGFPPPGPRIDVDYRANPSSGFSGVITPTRGAGAPVPVDLDRATQREIERLPWVGPALARRIVANRDSFGSFGSLEALGRVKGVGQATRNRLAALVTFSGGPSSRP